MKTISQILGVTAVAALVVAVSLQADSLTSPKQSGTPAATASSAAPMDHCAMNHAASAAKETGCCHATPTASTEKDSAMACAKTSATQDHTKAAMGGCCHKMN